MDDNLKNQIVDLIVNLGMAKDREEAESFFANEPIVLIDEDNDEDDDQNIILITE